MVFRSAQLLLSSLLACFQTRASIGAEATIAPKGGGQFSTAGKLRSHGVRQATVAFRNNGQRRSDWLLSRSERRE